MKHGGAGQRRGRARVTRALLTHALLPLLVLASLACAEVRQANAQTIDPAKAAKVKAAYLLNFVRYTQWPDSKFAGPESPVVLKVVGECDVADVLEEAVGRSEPIGGREVVLRTTYLARQSDEALDRFYADLENSHLVYLCSLPTERARAILRRLDAANVLTVGDIPNFAEDGGMLGFVLTGDRIVFEANPKAIQMTGIAVSAKVLKLAHIVESEK